MIRLSSLRQPHLYVTTHKVIFLLLIIWSLTGCEGRYAYYRNYDGKALPKREVGIIRGYDFYRTRSAINSMLKIVAINGKEIAKFGAGVTQVEVLPGNYTVDIMYVIPYGTLDYYNRSTLTLDVKAGQAYALGAQCNLNNKHLIYYYDLFDQVGGEQIKKKERQYDPDGVRKLTIINREEDIPWSPPT